MKYINLNILTAILTIVGTLMCPAIFAIIFRKEPLEWRKKKYKDLWITTAIVMFVNTGLDGVINQIICNYIEKCYYDNSVTSEFESPIGLIIFIDLVILLIIGLLVAEIFKNKCSIETKKSLIEKINVAMKNEIDGVKTLDCVFTVSTILFKDNKFLLVKRDYGNGEEKWIQPGSYYRTNCAFEPDDDIDRIYNKVFPPYDYLTRQLDVEAGIGSSEYYKILDFSLADIAETIETSRLINAEEDISTGYNKVSPVPFLIQFEESDTAKSSGKRIHIDLFYAIKLANIYNIDISKKKIGRDNIKYTDIKFFSIQDIKDELDKNTMYNDLYVICNKFLKCYRKTKFDISNIRTCTFNNSKKSLLIRIGDICNMNCMFCIRGNDRNAADDACIVMDGLSDKVFEVLKNAGTKHKLIVSGGEPSVYNNCLDVLRQIAHRCASRISEITICTNGCAWEGYFDDILVFRNMLDKKNIKLKFVIGMSWFNSDSFTSIMGNSIDGESLVHEFVNFLENNKIEFEISLVITTYFRDNLESYIKLWKAIGVKNISLSYACKCSNRRTY